MKLVLQGAAGVAMLLMAATAWAHAQLDHASPAVGSEVKASPGQVQVWFDDEVNPSGTTIQVFDPAGKQIDLKDSKQDKKDKALMTVSVPKTLPDGVYKVKWHALCLEGHNTEGDYTFTVKAKP
jgi:hypothetical protein